jgi:hypothetical protein
MSDKSAIQLVGTLLHPTIWEHSNCYKNFYKECSVMSRCIFMPLAAIRGAGKVFLFPVIMAVGAVALPLIGLFKSLWNSDGSGWEHLKAGGICLLGAGAVLGFMLVSAYHLPLIASTSIFMSAMVVSICIHVYRAVDVEVDEIDPKKASDDILTTVVN